MSLLSTCAFIDCVSLLSTFAFIDCVSARISSMSRVRSSFVVGETVGGFVGGVELEVSVIILGLEEVLCSRADLRCGSVEMSLACL